MADAVLQWAGLAKKAQTATGVPANVLLGLISVESAGIEGRTSSAGAGGLTQFIPSTAAHYGVNVAPGHAESQIMGAARYLVDLGYAKDPAHALNAYNGAQTIGGRANPYAGNVLQAAKRYAGAGAGASSSATPTTPAAPAATGTPAASSSGELFGQDKRSDLLKALLWVSLAAAGTALAGIGLKQSLGAGAT